MGPIDNIIPIEKAIRVSSYTRAILTAFYLIIETLQQYLNIIATPVALIFTFLHNKHGIITIL